MTVSAKSQYNQPHPLASDQVAQYRENGWLLLREVLGNDQARAAGEVIREAARKHNRETRPLEERDAYGRAFLQVMNLWQVEESVRPFSLASRFAGIAARLLGVQKVRIYHDQALFKEPGGGFTPWHQDGFYWPINQQMTVTMWMPLIDVDATMGSMTFASRSQRDGFVEVGAQISEHSEAFFEGYIKAKGYLTETGGPMAAGDATFHSGVTLHRAPGNPTDRVREVMTVIYMADNLTINEPENDFQRADLATWFPGLKPGDLAASSINPILG